MTRTNKPQYQEHDLRMDVVDRYSIEDDRAREEFTTLMMDAEAIKYSNRRLYNRLRSRALDLYNHYKQH